MQPSPATEEKVSVKNSPKLFPLSVLNVRSAFIIEIRYRKWLSKTPGRKIKS